MHHHLQSSPETVHWGWFDAALPHVLTIDSGDRVTIESLSGGPANLPRDSMFRRNCCRCMRPPSGGCPGTS